MFDCMWKICPLQVANGWGQYGLEFYNLHDVAWGAFDQHQVYLQMYYLYWTKCHLPFILDQMKPDLTSVINVCIYFNV